MSYEGDKEVNLHALLSAESDNAAPAQSWMISFGDLLTLLLCFFLSIVSFSPLNPKSLINKNKEKPDSYVSQMTVSEDYRARPKDGISFALNNVESLNESDEAQSEELTLLESDLGSNGVSLAAEAVDRLKKVTTRVSYTNRRLEIEACSRNLSETQEASWQRTSSLVLGIRRQILDAIPEVDASQIALRVLGQNCGDSEGFIADSKPVVVILRLGKEKVNG